jgi:hypothetical protein
MQTLVALAAVGIVGNLHARIESMGAECTAVIDRTLVVAAGIASLKAQGLPETRDYNIDNKETADKARQCGQALDQRDRDTVFNFIVSTDKPFSDYTYLIACTIAGPEHIPQIRAWLPTLTDAQEYGPEKCVIRILELGQHVDEYEIKRLAFEQGHLRSGVLGISNGTFYAAASVPPELRYRLKPLIAVINRERAEGRDRFFTDLCGSNNTVDASATILRPDFCSAPKHLEGMWEMESAKSPTPWGVVVAIILGVATALSLHWKARIVMRVLNGLAWIAATGGGAQGCAVNLFGSDGSIAPGLVLVGIAVGITVGGLGALVTTTMVKKDETVVIVLWFAIVAAIAASASW